MKKILLFVFVALFSINFDAQVKKKSISASKSPKGVIRCYTTENEEKLQKKNNKRTSNDSFENWIATKISKQKSIKGKISAIKTIPVVIHVISSGEAVGTGANISDAQVISQITTLNNDYRKKVGTRGYNSNIVGADANIEFALAVRDPNGNPTNGIDRISFCKTSWWDDEIESILKPQTIWDPTKYLNIWVTPDIVSTIGGVLGYAQFPSASGLSGLDEPDMTSDANTDGVVIAYNYFGNLDYDDGSFNLDATYGYGRTTTHEVGHWLGLRHIWGDANCGTDYVADTPIHQEDNYGCFTHPKPNDCGTADEMFENYMDYTDDTCMNIFTVNQVDRFNAVLANSPRRKELLSSDALTPVTVYALDGEIKLNQICDISNDCVKANLNARLINRGSSPITSAILSITDGTQNYNKSWSGNLLPNKEVSIPISLVSKTSTNNVSVNISSLNGSTDQRATNNSGVESYQYVTTNSFNTTQVKLALQLDEYGSETSWKLEDASGNVLFSSAVYDDTSTPPAVKNFTFNLANNACYVFKIFDSYGDGLIDGYYKLTTSTGSIMINKTDFSSDYDSYSFTLGTLLSTSENLKASAEIYPNPATDFLNVSKVSSKAKYTIHSVDGKLVSKGNLTENKVVVSKLEKGVYVITIEDNGKTSQSKFIKK